jgi:solute carrier family 9B (sodium/hydrogen exchanger), member 1/2
MFFLSLGMILVVGGIFGFLAGKIRIPSLIVYLLLGIIMGYFGLIDQSILNISSELRKIALIIILIKGGLSLDLKDLKKTGRPALLLSFIPAVIEMVTIGLIGPLFLDLTYLESFILGSVLGAVSPAVVVPRMIKMIENNQGVKKGIPQMIIAGSSLDDIVMIVCFTALLTIEGGDSLSAMTFINVPISILSGIGIGILTGFLLSVLFKKVHMRDSLKLALILGICFCYVFLESYLSQWVGFSSLLAAITIGITLLARNAFQAKRIAQKCDRLWSVSEIFLFVLVGASIKLDAVWPLLLPALGVVAIGLVFRIAGTYLCTIKTHLNFKERTFVSISYVPKATVQATIGGGLLDLGNKLGNATIQAAGQIVLVVSVVAILLTATFGAFAIDLSVNKLVPRDETTLTLENK